MKRIVAAILIVLVGLMTPIKGEAKAVLDWFFDDEVCEGKEEAGAEIKKQILKQDKEASVLYHDEDFNMFLSSTSYNEVYREIYAESDDPSEGDYLYTWGRPTDGENCIQTYKRDDGGYNVRVTYKMTYFITKKEQKEFEKETEKILDSLDIEHGSDYEKVKKIYNYICSNVVYDYKNLEDDTYLKKYTAYAAVFDKTAVCSGISQLFYYMAKSVGLDVRMIINDTHAWNFVKVDGKYYYVDATWDLGKSEKDYKYFLKGNADFEEHQGNVTWDLFGSADALVNSDRPYYEQFSQWEYGSENNNY